MGQELKVTENRLRRIAARRGYRLEKSRRRDKNAIDYGGFMLVDAYKNTVVLEQPASPIAQHSTKSKASLIRERAPNHHRRWPRFPVTAPVGAALMPPRHAPCCILLIMVKPKPAQDEKGRFIAGNSGNGGRKPGSRAKLGEAFVADLCADWEKHGIETIARVREQRPHEYLKVVASILWINTLLWTSRSRRPLFVF